MWVRILPRVADKNVPVVRGQGHLSPAPPYTSIFAITAGSGPSAVFSRGGQIPLYIAGLNTAIRSLQRGQ